MDDEDVFLVILKRMMLLGIAFPFILLEIP